MCDAIRERPEGGKMCDAIRERPEGEKMCDAIRERPERGEERREEEHRGKVWCAAVGVLLAHFDSLFVVV